MRNVFLGFLRGLKSLFWLLARLFGKKRKFKTNEREKKLRAYVLNFSPGRLKNISYQKALGKKKKKNKRKFSKDKA